MVDKPNKPKKKVYSNEHPKYKDSKSYSEKEVLEFNRTEAKEKDKDWNTGKTRSNMPVGDSNTKSNMKIIDPTKRWVGGKLESADV
jgi:hypothetical protein